MGAVRPAILAVTTDMTTIDVPKLVREGREARRQIMLGAQLDPKWKRPICGDTSGTSPGFSAAMRYGSIDNPVTSRRLGRVKGIVNPLEPTITRFIRLKFCHAKA